MKFKLISAISAVALLAGSSLALIPALITQTGNVSNETNNNTILETNNIKHSENVQVVNSLNQIEIVDVASDSTSYAAIVNNNGKQEIYVWGQNTYGQLGLGDTTNRLVPTLLDSSKLGNYKSIKEITVSDDYAKIIVDTDNGEQIYVFGRNQYGQLGIGNNIDQSSPVLFDTTIFGNYTSIKEIHFIYNGVSYAIILDNVGNDQFFVWGNNEFGQLGLGNTVNQYRPAKFATSNFGVYTSIRELKFGTYGSYSILVREDGKNELYTWGNNANGQLGIGSTINQSRPTKVNIASGQNIKFIKSSYYILYIVVTNNGIDQLYTCGDGSYGLLLHGGTSSPGTISTPQLVSQSLLHNATEIIEINGGLSIYASVKISGQLRFISWGYNSHGEVMVGSAGKVWIPTLIDNSRLGNFTEVYNSVFTSNNVEVYDACYAYVKTASGDKLYVWGSNQYGQLGIGNTTVDIYWPVEAQGLDLSTAKITKFPVFKSSNILRLERNNQAEYFGTGSNNFGQLALNNTATVSTFTKILPARYTNPMSRSVNTKLTAVEVLNLINPNNVINLNELEKYVDTTSFPTGSNLSIDMSKTTINLEQGILNLGISTNKYDNLLVIDTVTSSKTFEVPIIGLWKASNINTTPVFVRAELFPNKDQITIEQLYNAICNSDGKVMNRPLLEQYMDLTSIPPTAQLYLLPNSLDNSLQATFTLKSNEVYFNGITTPLDYIEQDLTISLEDMTNWTLVISLSVVGGVLIIVALIAFILIKRNSNRIIL